MFANPWTDDRIKQLETLHAQGLSGSEIGSAMGVSRNTVRGKIHRLHLVPRIRAPVARKPRKVYDRKIKPAVILPKPPEVPVFKPSKNLSIYELTDTTCRWPTSETKPLTYCGCRAPKERTQPYCAYHADQALGGWKKS
jgi:GcrA cell cycle regulator